MDRDSVAHLAKKIRYLSLFRKSSRIPLLGDGGAQHEGPWSPDPSCDIPPAGRIRIRQSGERGINLSCVEPLKCGGLLQKLA